MGGFGIVLIVLAFAGVILGGVTFIRKKLNMSELNGENEVKTEEEYIREDLESIFVVEQKDDNFDESKEVGND